MKQNPYAGLKKIILASMILVPLVPFVLALGIGNYYFTGSLENNTIASIQRIVQDHRQMIESFLMERKADLDFILDAYTFEDLSGSDKLRQTFKNLQKESHAFADLGIFDENGLHVAYHGPYQLSGKVYDQAPWFKAVMKNGFYISNVFLGYRQVPHFVIAVARVNQGRQWVIRATIDTQIFNDLVKKVRIGKTGEAYLLDAKGVFQTERRSGGSLMSKDPDRSKYGPVHDGIKTFIGSDAHGETFTRKSGRLQSAAPGLLSDLSNQCSGWFDNCCRRLFSDGPDYPPHGKYGSGKKSNGRTAHPCRTTGRNR